MRIGLLTVPFNNNYGGFLQAFALKTFLESRGHQVTIINRQRDLQKQSFLKKTRKTLRSLFYRKKTIDLSIHTRKFVKGYLSPITKEIYSTEMLLKLPLFDFYIVGSDQVWRYEYATSSINNYFFDFLQDTNIPRISYAASFGVSYNEYDKDSINRCSELLKHFKSISVREFSGINLLKDTFKVKYPIEYVLDPTMIIDKNIYIDLTQKYPINNRSNYIFTYILDKTDDKQLLIDKISEEEKVPIQNIDAQTGNNNKVIEPIEKWLSYIINASYVITDSFHGMIFSIIFNKPFIVYANETRGAERFKSLLSLLNLNSCIINNSKSYKKQEFNWKNINMLVDKYKEKSIKFLTISLESKSNDWN